MISKEELEKYSKQKGRGLGETEKDYLLELALLVLSRETKNDLIFKGGTCLYKLHNLNRFSEDLDFSARGELDAKVLFDKLLHGLADFGIKGNLKGVKEPFNSVLATLLLEGPLFDGRRMTLANIRVDINLKSEVLLQTSAETFYSAYREILPFQINSMDPKEMAAEKIRAILTRDKARDVFDLWFLFRKNAVPSKELMKKKLEYYDLEFDPKAFEKRLGEKEAEWKTDLERLVFGPLPEFKSIRKEILSNLR